MYLTIHNLKDRVVDHLLGDQTTKAEIEYMNGESFITQDPMEFQYQIDQTEIDDIAIVTVHFRNFPPLEYDRQGNHFLFVD